MRDKQELERDDVEFSEGGTFRDGVESSSGFLLPRHACRRIRLRTFRARMGVT